MGVCVVNCDRRKLSGIALRYDAVKDKYLIMFRVSKIKQWVSAERVKVRLEDMNKGEE
jgi:hypothetical protein